MTTAPAFEVKGWCPGALRPMESGDGLIVRIRTRGGSLSRGEMAGIAVAAESYGNGHIDLTRRANLQIRGVRPQTLGALQEALGALGMLDESAEAESVRNIVISPFAGLNPCEVMDMRPLAAELAECLTTEPSARALPAKFSFVLDGGNRELNAEQRDENPEQLAFANGSLSHKEREPDALPRPSHGGSHEESGRPDLSKRRWSSDPDLSADGLLTLADVRADIRLLACLIEGRPMIAMACANEWVGVMAPECAVAAVCAVIAGKTPGLEHFEPDAAARVAAHPGIGYAELGADLAVIGLGVPFGRIEAGQLQVLAQLAAEIRLSPWRILYLRVESEAAAKYIAASARQAGFVTEAGDPLMRIQACPGHPACRSAHADTRTDAKAIAGWMAATGFSGTAHVSGCAKGCASSAPADLTLVGVPGGYRLMRGAPAREEGGTFISLSEIPAGLAAPSKSPGAARRG